MPASYRDQFVGGEDAHFYEAQQYGAESYSQLLWMIEQRFLQRMISEMPIKPSDYLDFACGTGRVLSFVEPYVDSATGLDVSESMLSLARAKTKAARLVCEDITRTQKPREQYDLITAFRFVLNAEHELRRKSLRELALRLKGRESRLIFNNHGNPLSHKALMWPYHRLGRRFHESYRPAGNYLTHRQISQLVSDAGLEIIEVFGYGHCSSKALRILDFETVLRMESFLAGRPIAGKFGVNQIYVTRLQKR